MTISLKHKFQSALSDSPNPSLIRPSNWNDEHDLILPGKTIVGRTEDTSGAASALTSDEVLALLGSDAGVFIRPESYGAFAYSTRTEAISGTDSSSAFDDMFAAWYAAGGGTIKLSGWYRVSKAFQLANSNTLTTIGTQPPLVINGIGGHATLGRPEGGSGIVWTAETGDAPAKLTTLGRGLLVLDNCVFASAPGSGNVKPFVHTTFTTIRTGAGFAFDGAVYGASADEDGFILGGQTPHELDPDFDRRDPDCGFQGYGTVISRVFCNGIRRLAVGQRYANAIRITDNVMWNTCGNDSSTGGAIEFDGDPTGVAGSAVGNVIANNLVEVLYYRYAVHLKNCIQCFAHGNDCYDAATLAVAAIYVDSSCQNIRVIASLGPAAKPYLVDPGAVVSIFGQESSRYDVFRSIKAGWPGYPNLFGLTKFVAGSSGVVIQPDAPSSNVQFELRRSAAETADPGVNIFSIGYNGAINWGNASAPSQGNITTTLPTAVSWSNNGRKWACNGSGATMEQNSGTGGSFFDMKNFKVRSYTHAGVLHLTFNGVGPNGQEGIAFGASADTMIYRVNADALKVSDTLLTGEYTVATLPAASTTLKGARAYVTDATSPTFLGTLTGGGSVVCPVFCNGSAWVAG